MKRNSHICCASSNEFPSVCHWLNNELWNCCHFGLKRCCVQNDLPNLTCQNADARYIFKFFFKASNVSDKFYAQKTLFNLFASCCWMFTLRCWLISSGSQTVWPTNISVPPQAFSSTGTNLHLHFLPPNSHNENGKTDRLPTREYVDFDREIGRVSSDLFHMYFRWIWCTR
jgi:hypothetical protein